MNIDADPLLRLRFLAPALRNLVQARLLPVRPESISYYLSSKTPPNFIYWHIDRRALPFADHTAEAVYMSHALEHFPRYIGSRVAREVRRVLLPGGVFRVVVPDLEIIANRYLTSLGRPVPNSNQTTGSGMSARDVNFVFYQGCTHKHIEQTHRLDSIDWERVRDLFLRTTGHMYIYDFGDLSSLLKESGFSRVERRGYKEGVCPDIDLLDSRPEESLFVEAFSEERAEPKSDEPRPSRPLGV